MANKNIKLKSGNDILYPQTKASLLLNDDGTKWKEPKGTNVEANPTGTGTTDLTRLKVGSTVYNIPSGGGSSFHGYNLTYDMEAGIPGGMLFLEYLYIDSNGDFKSERIETDGTHKSGTLTNVLMVRHNGGNAKYVATISGVNFSVWQDTNSQIYTDWLTDNRTYTASVGGGGGGN